MITKVQTSEKMDKVTKNKNKTNKQTDQAHKRTNIQETEQSNE